MIRLGVSVEGPTEREFISRVLAPHLWEHQVFATAIDMGGNVSLDRIRNELRRLLRTFERVTTLYDYYGFKGRGSSTSEQLEQAISQTVKEAQRVRVIPYIQLYEFEALIFADPEITASELGQPALAAQVEAVVRQCEEPEAIDDGFETCPSRRIKSLFPGYDKKLHGPTIVGAIGLDVLRQRCPRFGAWLTGLEQLAA